MTIECFKAWLLGFEESIDGAPTPEQWRKIQDKINEVRSEAAPVVAAPIPWWIINPHGFAAPTFPTGITINPPFVPTTTVPVQTIIRLCKGLPSGREGDEMLYDRTHASN